MKTCFVHRLGAFGDVLHASHLPRLIKEYYKVDRLDFETSTRGMQILQKNPYIDTLTCIDADKMDRNTLFTKWKYMEDEYDLVFNLINTIEVEYCCNETDQRYYRNDAYRREKCGKMNYYDVMTASCNLPEVYYGTRGELYYPNEEHVKAAEWVYNKKIRHNADWIILVCLSGSSLHKRFQKVESVCRKILDRYQDAIIILTGDKECEDLLFVHNRVFPKLGRWNMRTVMLMAKYFDFVISPETGLVCVSHMWNTPTLQLLTAATWDNHIKYAKNAYWVQSDAPCSPCCKNPAMYYGCTRKDGIPICAASFDEDKIMAKVEEAYVVRKDVSRSSVLV